MTIASTRTNFLDRLAETLEFICKEKKSANDIRAKVDAIDATEIVNMIPLLAKRLKWPGIKHMGEIRRGCLSSQYESRFRECTQFMKVISCDSAHENIRWISNEFYSCGETKNNYTDTKSEKKVELKELNKPVENQGNKEELSEVLRVIKIINKSYEYPGRNRSCCCKCHNHFIK